MQKLCAARGSTLPSFSPRTVHSGLPRCRQPPCSLPTGSRLPLPRTSTGRGSHWPGPSTHGFSHVPCVPSCHPCLSTQSHHHRPQSKPPPAHTTLHALGWPVFSQKQPLQVAARRLAFPEGTEHPDLKTWPKLLLSGGPSCAPRPHLGTRCPGPLLLLLLLLEGSERDSVFALRLFPSRCPQETKEGLESYGRVSSGVS